MDDLYFSRTTPWSRLGDHIVAHDSKSAQAPRMVTMEPWHEMVFLAADGEHTVGQFVEHMGSQYEGGAPPGLGQQIHDIVNALIDESLLNLHEEPSPLPPYIAEEHFDESPETRKRQMEEDGFIEPEE